MARKLFAVVKMVKVFVIFVKLVVPDNIVEYLLHGVIQTITHWELPVIYQHGDGRSSVMKQPSLAECAKN